MSHNTWIHDEYSLERIILNSPKSFSPSPLALITLTSRRRSFIENGLPDIPMGSWKMKKSWHQFISVKSWHQFVSDINWHQFISDVFTLIVDALSEWTCNLPKLYTRLSLVMWLCGLGYQSIFPISFRVISLALVQSYDCPSASEETLKNMGQWTQLTL